MYWDERESLSVHPPRNTERPLQASTDESEDTEHSTTKRRRVVGTSITPVGTRNTPSTSTTRNHALPSSSSAAVSSDQQQSESSANTGGHSVVEPAVSQSVERQIPMIDPRLQSLLRGPSGLTSLTREWYHPMPTLDEAVPASCSWRGGIFVSLYVSDLPQDAPLYARFGYNVVRTVCVRFNPLRVAHRSHPGSEDPPYIGMQGPGGRGPMRS